MEELTLEQIKARELNVLRQFDAFCRENNIRYFLSNGTLLGAVKYKGFIPWDDDIDVLIPRGDYNRFLELFPKGGAFELLCRERDAEYPFPFAKLSEKETVITNQTTLKNYRPGLHIDIFPLDFWGEDIEIAKKQANALRSLCNKYAMSFSRIIRGRNVVRTVAKTVLIALARIRGRKRIETKLKAETDAVFKTAGESFCGCVVWAVYGEGEIHQRDIFEDAVEVEFEGGKYPAPKGYDAYLKSHYGDYEKDPPNNKRRSHHSFKAYKL